LNALWKDIRKKKGLLILAAPGLVFLLVFSYLPMLGIFIAFININYTKGIFHSPWVGFANFRFFFESQDFARITRNTIVLNVMFIIINMVLAIVLALILFELSRRAVKVYQTILFIPYLLSWVVASYALYVFLNNDYGVFNKFLQAVGGNKVNWYGVAPSWPTILTLAFLWKNLGYSAIIYYTGLLGIDSTYYEAADIDGGSRLQQLRYITLPLLTPLIALILITQMGRIFSADFGMFYFLTKDSPMLYPTTDVIDTYVFRALRKIGDPSMAAAVALYQSAVGCLLVVGVNALIRRINRENAMF
jgi:putative aldouronate transport system permease protein